MKYQGHTNAIEGIGDWSKNSSTLERRIAVTSAIFNDPLISNNRLATDFGIGASTISQIRSRLRKRDLFSLRFAPNFSSLENVGVIATLGRHTLPSKQFRGGSRPLIYPGKVNFSISDAMAWSSIGVTPYNPHALIEAYESSEFTRVLFDAKDITNFFDYSNPVSLSLSNGLRLPSDQNDASWSIEELTKSELEVLDATVK